MYIMFEFSKKISIFWLFSPLALFGANHDAGLNHYAHILEQYRFEYASGQGSYRVEVVPKESEQCKPIGFLLMSIDWNDSNLMHIDLIDIQEPHRSQGIGSLLLQFALKVASDTGCNHIRLTASTQSEVKCQLDERLKRLVEWYKRFGFKEIVLPDGIEGSFQDMQADAPFTLNMISMVKAIIKHR